MWKDGCCLNSVLLWENQRNVVVAKSIIIDCFGCKLPFCPLEGPKVLGGSSGEDPSATRQDFPPSNQLKDRLSHPLSMSCIYWGPKSRSGREQASRWQKLQARNLSTRPF